MCSQRYALALQEYQRGITQTQERSLLRQCGLLSVASIDLQDAVQYAELTEVAEVQTAIKLLEEALKQAESAKIAVQAYL